MNKYMPPTLPPALVPSGQAFRHAPEPEADGSGTAIGQLGNVLRRRWLMLLCCALTATIAAGAVGLHTPRLYTAWAQVVITPQNSQSSPGMVDRGEEATMNIETQVSVLESRDLLSRVLARLIGTPGFPILDFGREGKVHQLARRLVAKVEEGSAGTWLSAVLGPDLTASLQSIAVLPDPRQRREAIIDELLRNLKVNSEPRSRVVSVRYTATTPELAALITNMVVETYISSQMSAKREDIRLELARLDKELPSLEAALRSASAQIRAYRLEHAVPDANGTESQEQQAVALKAGIKAIDADLARTKADQAALARLRDRPQSPPVSTRFSTVLAGLQDEERLHAQPDPDRTGQARPEAAPQPDAADPATLRQRIVAEVDLASARAADETTALVQRRRTLQGQLDAMQVSLEETQPAADRLKELGRLLDAKRQLYEDSLLRQEKLLRGQDQVSADAFVLSAAAPPQKPATASPLLFLPPAFVVGLLVGGLLAVWRDVMDTGLRSERLISQVLGIPCAGFLPPRPPLTKASAGLPREGLYTTALRLIFNTTTRVPSQDGCRSLLVTSSVSGEGGRVLAEDLAVYAAKLAPSVLMIDLQPVDRRRASRPERRWPDGSDLASPIPGFVLTKPAGEAGLQVLRTDDLDPTAIDLRLHRDLPHALQTMRDTFDCIVIHAGPVLETATARLLAGEVDHTLIAVRWGHTRRSTVENALAILGRVESGMNKPATHSTVLTEVNIRRHLSYRFGDAIEALARAFGRHVPA